MQVAVPMGVDSQDTSRSQHIIDRLERELRSWEGAYADLVGERFLLGKRLADSEASSEAKSRQLRRMAHQLQEQSRIINEAWEVIRAQHRKNHELHRQLLQVSPDEQLMGVVASVQGKVERLVTMVNDQMHGGSTRLAEAADALAAKDAEIDLLRHELSLLRAEASHSPR